MRLRVPRGSESDPRSLWLRQALDEGFEAQPPVQGRVRADVCVVGGGYTGLWTALHLREADPSLSVLLVEADICGGGASGRNGGFVLSWWAKFGSLAKACGTTEALRLARASGDAVEAIGAFADRHAIDAGFRQNGWLWAATNQAQLDSWRSTIEALDALDVRPFTKLDPDAAARTGGSGRHVGAVFEGSGAVVQPALLALGLRRVALERGLRIFEGAPVVSLRRRRGAIGGHEVRTSRGVVEADRVVLATGAWAAAVPDIHRRVLVLGSDMLATRPAGRDAPLSWDRDPAVSDSRLLVHYYRATRDGRLAFGKGGGSVAFGRTVGATFEGRSRRATDVERAMRWTYPTLDSLAVESTWTGPVDRTRSGLPFFAELPRRPGVIAGVGYSGNGVGPSYLGGKILASLALGRRDEWSECGLVGLPREGFPPEPFRYLGGLVVRSAIARKERAEDRSRRVDAVTSVLVRLAPAGLVPTTRG
jgi:glycine/D-amino acid oxidase-like deaminating enzyme